MGKGERGLSGVRGLSCGTEHKQATFLVTSKNTEIAEQMLVGHSLRYYFDTVIGTERDSRFGTKIDAVRFILEQSKLTPDATVIVGDREHDGLAGKNNGIFTVGVSYGYGSKRELVEAGADRICDNPRELIRVLRS